MTGIPDGWEPCVAPPCPPAELFEVSWTPIVCPECGVVPVSCHSIFVMLDHDIVWTCPTHGVVEIGAPT